MLVIGLALASAIAVQGNMKSSIDQFAYRSGDSAVMLELSVSIPFNSLTFIRAEERYTASYRVAAQLLDARRQPVAGDVWLNGLTTDSYEATASRDSSATGYFTVVLPASAVQARVDISDANSERKAWAAFVPARPQGKSSLRLMRSGSLNPSRAYSLQDTIEAVFRSQEPGTGDSVRFALTRNGRPVLNRVERAVESAGAAVARMRVPVADSAGLPALKSGAYLVSAGSPKPDGASDYATADLRVELPLFLDDSAYQERVEQLVYVATIADIRRLKAISTTERESAWVRFWRAYDPSPSSRTNEREQEYFERIDYAQEHFGGADRGYRSDRGRVYVTYGPPDQTESRPFDIDRPAQEVWYYYERSLTFLFVDRFGWGEFRLTSPGESDGR